MTDAQTSPTPIAVAAPHPAAVDAARSVAADGGSVVDAAVAAAAALAVVYPHMCSIGGDLIAVVREADGTSWCVNASGTYGSAASDAQRAQLATAMPVTGPLTVTVPGLVSGWRTLLDRWGRIGHARVLRDAIELAHEGVEVSPGVGAALASGAEALRADTGFRDVFFADGAPLAVGARLRQPALAATLRRLSEAGLDDYYRGEVGRRLAAGLAALDVPVGVDDLASYEPVVEAPLERTFDGVTVRTAGPNSQGFTFLRSLGAFLAAGVGEPDRWRLLAELFHDGDVLRDTVLGDPRRAAVDVQPYVSDTGIASALEGARRVPDAGRAAAPWTPRPGGDTIGIAVIGDDGTAVSLIQSIFHSFGSRLLEPDTGILLHNRGSFFSTESESPNVVAPGKRPAHTLVPVIAEFDDGMIAVHSTMGGKAQSQIQTQLMLRALEGLGAQEIVDAPRCVVGGLDVGDDEDHMLVEAGTPDDRRAQFASTGMRIIDGERFDGSAGHSMVARLHADGRLEAGADPRSDGTSFAAVTP